MLLKSLDMHARMAINSPEIEHFVFLGLLSPGGRGGLYCIKVEVP